MKVTKTEKELFEFSKDICYEVNQFDFCVKSLRHLPESPEQYVFITTLATHARNLHEFIYKPEGKRRWEDQAIAEDYFKDTSVWFNNRYPESNLLHDMHDWADTTIAHLSYTRLDLKPWWIWLDAHDEMKPALNSFVSTVDPMLIVPELRDFERRWEWTNGLPRRPTPTPPAT